jgi:hypothetical protein
MSFLFTMLWLFGTCFLGGVAGIALATHQYLLMLGCFLAIILITLAYKDVP